MTSRLSSHLHIPGAEARKERGGCERFEEKFAPLAFASRKYSSGCVVAASRKQFARLTFGRRFWATRALERNTHLCELIVQDFAIMKEQTIRLDPGLNIITGQSGSGKSIFLEVVAQLCGAVAGEELIRFGAESALVHGKFNIGSDKMSAVCNILRHHNVPTDTFSTTSIANHHLPENAVGAKSEPAGLSDQLLVERRLSFVHFNEGDEPPVDSLASSRMMSTPLKRRVRSACRINGTRVPLKALRKLGKVLVDFNGQSAASHLAE
jgi:energy-coupling factor transporter ATP-binding protein EcfA2